MQKENPSEDLIKFQGNCRENEKDLSNNNLYKINQDPFRKTTNSNVLSNKKINELITNGNGNKFEKRDSIINEDRRKSNPRLSLINKFANAQIKPIIEEKKVKTQALKMKKTNEPLFKFYFV